jgi:hypothetical protein
MMVFISYLVEHHAAKHHSTVFQMCVMLVDVPHWDLLTGSTDMCKMAVTDLCVHFVSLMYRNAM